MFKEIRFSIIFPVYNVEKYIKKSLESIVNQSFKNFECLIIDDGSSDNSINIAKQIINDDSRFKIYSKSNGGLSDARNYGIAKASGEYLFFVDSDDYIDLKTLELIDKNLTEDIDILSFNIINDYGDHYEDLIFSSSYLSDFKSDPSIIMKGHSANNRVIKRSFLGSLRFPIGMYYEDLAFIPKLIIKANKVKHLNEKLYYYVQREGSITHILNHKLFDIYTALEMLYEALLENERFNFDIYYTMVIINGFIMTNMKIGKAKSYKERKQYYKKHLSILNEKIIAWYPQFLCAKRGLKFKIAVFLFKHRFFFLIDRIYHK